MIETFFVIFFNFFVNQAYFFYDQKKSRRVNEEFTNFSEQFFYLASIISRAIG